MEERLDNHLNEQDAAARERGVEWSEDWSPFADPVCNVQCTEGVKMQCAKFGQPCPEWYALNRDEEMPF